MENTDTGSVSAIPEYRSKNVDLCPAVIVPLGITCFRAGLNSPSIENLLVTVSMAIYDHSPFVAVVASSLTVDVPTLVDVSSANRVAVVAVCVILLRIFM